MKTATQRAGSFHVRLARLDKYDKLSAIKLDASLMLGEIYSRPIKPEIFSKCIGQNGVAVVTSEDDIPRAYSLAYDMDDDLYLRHIFVHRNYNRKGLGTFLLNSVIERAKGSKKRAVTLTTSGSAPWNAPFYIRYGFVIVSQGMPVYLQQALAEEKQIFGAGDFSPEYPNLLPRVAMEKFIR